MKSAEQIIEAVCRQIITERGEDVNEYDFNIPRTEEDQEARDQIVRCMIAYASQAIDECADGVISDIGKDADVVKLLKQSILSVKTKLK